MKKIYLSLLVFAFGTSVNAQFDKGAIQKYNKANTTKSADFNAIKGEKVSKQKVAFFTNDFSNPSDWTIGNDANNNDNWVIGTNGPSGAFPLDPIVSTSAANGFALFDSDLLCSGDQQAWIQLTNPVDCSGKPNVQLEFENFYRSFQDSTAVQVSTDGINWTAFSINNQIADNSSTTNPELAIVNISSVAGNQATVYIRFYFYSIANISGPLGGCAYSWMIDDVALSEVPGDDLVLQDNLWGSTGYWGTMNYSQIPISQIAPITFLGEIKNAGVNTQSNITFDASSGAYTSSSDAFTIEADSVVVAQVNADFTPAAVAGSNPITMSVNLNGDATPDNNSVSAGVTVTQGIYARDLDAAAGYIDNAGNAFEAGNMYDAFGVERVKAIRFRVASTSNAGAVVFAKLYVFDTTQTSLASGLVYLDQSADYTLSANDLGQFITLELPLMPELTPGLSYLAVAGSYGDGGASNDLRVSTSGEIGNGESFILIDGTWYYFTDAAMVRMVMESHVDGAGINENSIVSSLEMYPNPAVNSTDVVFELAKQSNVEVKVVDVTGKEVTSMNLGSKNEGTNQVAINTKNYTNGIYFVNVITNNGTATKKLVVKK